MTLAEQIQADLTAAMKAREELRLSALRMVKSALKIKEIEKLRPLDDAEAQQVLQTLLKQRRDSIEQFTKGGRRDLAEKERREIAVLEHYLPAPAHAGEIAQAIEAAVAETAASSMQHMGAVMKAARTRLAGKTADGKLFSDQVRARLSGPR